MFNKKKKLIEEQNKAIADLNEKLQKQSSLSWKHISSGNYPSPEPLPTPQRQPAVS